MIDFTRRSYNKELLDRNDIPFAAIQQNMKELNFINTYLGGHSITLKGFKKLLHDRKTVSVCEMGCGGGDNLNAINKFCIKHYINIKLSGIDINPDCITYAKSNTSIPESNFITSDYKKIDFTNDKPDIIFSSLFCHHFTDEEIIEMMQWMKANSSLGFFINDLHRNPVAYHFIKIATSFFSKSYLVKNDAPLSVLRGFSKKELKNLLLKAGIKTYKLKWMWAFRFLLTVPNPKEK